MPRSIISSVLAGLCAVALAACSDADTSTASAQDVQMESAPQSAMPQQDPVMAALRHPDRPKEDREDDAKRHVKQVLWFMDVEAGDSVFEIEAGGGYYTEILSRLVGPGGQVVMQNPAAFDNFIVTTTRDGYDLRLGGDRLPNVRLSKSDFDELDAPDASMDIVTWVLGPHELWFSPAEGVSFGDPSTAFSEIARIMKPGASFIVIDHAAAPGAPPTTGGETHRISPEVVKNMAAAAGLELVDRSEVLANPDDDLTMNVFDETVRRKTDRFIFKFKKTEG